MYKIENKKMKVVKKALVYFHGFEYSIKEQKFIKNVYDDEYDFYFLKLYDYIILKSEKISGWINNICKYLIKLGKEYDEIILVGYSLGCVIAVNCASLSCVKRIVLISPPHYSKKMKQSAELCISDKTEKCLKKQGIDKSCFHVIVQDLLNNFEKVLMKVNSKIMIILNSTNSALEIFRKSEQIQVIEIDSKQLINQREFKLELIQNEDVLKNIKLAISLFLNQNSFQIIN